MKRIPAYIAILSIMLIFSCSSSPAVQEQMQEQTEEQGGTSVWKAMRNGKTMYLGGSIHVLREDDFPLPQEYDLAFEQSEILVLETDIRLAESEKFLQYIIRQMFIDKGQTIKDLLEADTYRLLTAALNRYGIPISAVSVIKPSMVMLMLSTMQLQEYGFTENGIDKYYLEMAETKNMQINFLETPEYQFDMLLSLGDDDENAYIKYFLYDMEYTENYLIELVDEWRTGGSEILELTLYEMEREWPFIYKSLCKDRNGAWLPQLEIILDSGATSFVITGLAHMHGPDGLLKQLKDRGCTIQKFR